MVVSELAKILAGRDEVEPVRIDGFNIKRVDFEPEMTEEGVIHPGYIDLIGGRP